MSVVLKRGGPDLPLYPKRTRERYKNNEE
jgi:hypothetical protein